MRGEYIYIYICETVHYYTIHNIINIVLLLCYIILYPTYNHINRPSDT